MRSRALGEGERQTRCGIDVPDGINNKTLIPLGRAVKRSGVGCGDKRSDKRFLPGRAAFRVEIPVSTPSSTQNVVYCISN